MAELIVAVIDLGSNSFRLQVSAVKDGIYKVIEEYKETVRIGEGVYKNGSFSEDDIDTIINTLKNMTTIIEKSKVDVKRAVGTAPFRDAKNATEVIHKVKETLGIEIEVLPGSEEARLTYLAATGYFDLNNENVLFVDIGGGSVELSYVSSGALEESSSLPLGCLRLTQNFIEKATPKPEEIRNMKKYIAHELKKFIKHYVPNKIVFTGGTVNNIANIYSKRNNLSDTVVKYVDSTFLNHFINEISNKSIDERKKIQGLESARADIILAAALIVQFITKKYNTGMFFTFSGGLRNGVTIDMLNKMGIKLFFQRENGHDIRYSKLIETGKKYNFEENHGMHVAALSDKLFDGLKKLLKLKESDRKLLEAAALLHDIGQHISYADHQKHSCYLIKNTELIGYNSEEKDIIALTAGYHRSKMPKKKHPLFLELDNHSQKKVIRLASILRMADGLDRSHMGALSIAYIEEDNKKVVVHITTNQDIGMEIDGFNKKKDLFEKITGKQILLAIRGSE